ncbi:MAG: hypothetical protein L6246_08510 [Thermodesulfovibrionales bacterium]|nr:hypothetical protein [bacterium]MCG2710339.1 hypothetical protein [Thermodesulfovibrionales bacterium]
MAVKSVDMVRKIRDKHYEETKGLSVMEQIKFIKGKSKDLQKKLKRSQRSTADNTVHV